MAINEQLDTLYKLKRIGKSNNRPLINTINQVIKSLFKSIHRNICRTFLSWKINVN